MNKNTLYIVSILALCLQLLAPHYASAATGWEEAEKAWEGFKKKCTAEYSMDNHPVEFIPIQPNPLINKYFPNSRLFCAKLKGAQEMAVIILEMNGDISEFSHSWTGEGAGEWADSPFDHRLNFELPGYTEILRKKGITVRTPEDATELAALTQALLGEGSGDAEIYKAQKKGDSWSINYNNDVISKKWKPFNDKTSVGDCYEPAPYFNITVDNAGNVTGLYMDNNPYN